MPVSFTLSTVPLLALTIYLWHRAKGELLPVVMFLSVFQAASIVNIQLGGIGIGIGPCYFVLLIALAKSIGLRPTQNVGTIPKVASLLIFLFVAYAGLSAFVNPFIFAGVPVSNPKFGDNVPMSWEAGHLNQLVYLALSLALYRVAAHKTPPDQLVRCLEWFIGGIVLASSLAIYQFITTKTPLPFPSEFLHTNPTYTIYEAYEIDGLPRMNSTFTEASAAAFSMAAGLALALWKMLCAGMSRRNITQVVVILTGLLLTLSTTGYICLTYLAIVGFAVYLFNWQSGRNSRVAKLVLAIPLLAVVMAVAANSEARESIDKVVHMLILDKNQTSSYQERTQSNVNALGTAAGTFWFGAGWGMCRASSFVPTLLGNVGIPGAALFLMFCLELLSPLVDGGVRSGLHGAVLFALGAVLLNLVVSAPEIVNPIIWLLFAVAAKLGSANRGAAPAYKKPLTRSTSAAAILPLP